MDAFDMVVIGAGPAGEKGQPRRPTGASVSQWSIGPKAPAGRRFEPPGSHRRRCVRLPCTSLDFDAVTFTLSLQLNPALALERLMARTTDVIATRTESVRLNLDRHGVPVPRASQLLPGPAVLVRADDGSQVTLRADSPTATGSRPLHPPEIPFDDPDVHDSESIIGLRAIPGQ